MKVYLVTHVGEFQDDTYILGVCATLHACEGVVFKYQQENERSDEYIQERIKIDKYGVIE